MILMVALGAQGLLRGAIREIFSLLGIVLGVFIGTRFALSFGRWASERSFEFSSEGAMKLAGFALIFLFFWGICLLLGLWLSKRLRKKESMTRSVAIWTDRLAGFIIGAGKMYVIFAAIIFALSQTVAISKWINNNLGSSFLYPSLNATGGFLVKLDEQARAKAAELAKAAAKSAEEAAQAIGEAAETLDANVAEIIDNGEDDENE
jgi:membrane protein required for colicin V production